MLRLKATMSEIPEDIANDPAWIAAVNELLMLAERCGAVVDVSHERITVHRSDPASFVVCASISEATDVLRGSQ